MIEARIVCVSCLVLLVCPPSPADEPAGSNPCDILPWQTVNNGLGAEPGVIREFASGVVMPPECLRDGRVWVPRIRLAVTRTAGGATDMEVRVSIRAPQSPGGPPGNVRTEPMMHTLANVPVFPGAGTYDVNTGPNNNQNVNNLLWGDYQYISVDMNGDQTSSQFVGADEIGPLDQDCWTGTGGQTPAEPCTSAAPNLSRLAVGATGYTFYGRYSTGEEIDGREPLGTSWGARYINGAGFPGPIGLRVWRDAGPHLEGIGGQTICEFFDIPADFEFQCTLSVSELALLAAGAISVELTGGTSARSTRMIPAEIFIFADAFESGDTSVWSSQVP